MSLALALALAECGGSGVAFAPNSLPNLVLWVRADFKILNGSNVQQLTDQSVSGANLTQGTAGAQPAWNATDVKVGNKPTVAIGAGKSLLGALTVAQPLTIYLVAYNSADGTQMFGGNTSRVDIGRAGVGYYGYAGSATIGTSAVDANAHAFCFVANDPSSKVFVDSSSVPIGTGFAGTDSLVGPIISNFPGTGAVAEVAVYSVAHSSGQIAQLFGYFAARYGLSVG
jgi:hypothetical protein